MNEKASTRDLDDSEILDAEEGEDEDEVDDVIEIRYILVFTLMYYSEPFRVMLINFILS